MRRLVPGIVLALTVAAPASADVKVDKPTAAAGSEQEVHFTVPDDYDAPGAVMTYVEFDFPEGFALVECVPLETWSCTADVPKRRAIFQRQPSSVRNDGEENRLGVRVRAAPTAGRYGIQVTQWYKSGQVVRWNGPPGSERPAPVVEVTGSAPAVTATSVDVSSGTPSTMEARRLVSPKIRTRSTERPVGAYIAAAVLGALVAGLWWRRRRLPAGRQGG